VSAFDPALSDRARGLLSRVERHGADRALGQMTDPDLDHFIDACQMMLARPGRAASAHRRWRELLTAAHAEHTIRNP